MRCKVPAASGPRGLLATHAPPRRPEVPPAAHTDRMLQTPQDIATRSQSAGRGVNLPAASSAAPRQAPAQLERALPPPEHAWGLAASTHQGVSSPLGTPSPASLGGFQTRELGLGRVGQLWALCPTGREVPAFALGSLGSSFLFREAGGTGGPFSRWKPMPKCPLAAHQLLPHSTGQGATLSSR